MKYLVAIGITSKGERKEFKINDIGNLYCYSEDLVSLEIPSGMKEIYSWNNNLTELIIPEGVEYLDCSNNKISELNIPNTLKKLYCDRHVKGLDNIHSECEIILF